MERSTQKNGLVNFLALLVVGVAGFAVARSSGSLAGEVTSLFLGMGLLVALISWFQMRLEQNERLERLELEELAKTHSATAMFDAKDSEVFPAQRSREQFERFFVPGFTVLLFAHPSGRGLVALALARQPGHCRPDKEPQHRPRPIWHLYPGPVPLGTFFRHLRQATKRPPATAGRQPLTPGRLSLPGRGHRPGHRLVGHAQGRLLCRLRDVRPSGTDCRRNPGRPRP